MAPTSNESSSHTSDRAFLGPDHKGVIFYFTTLLDTARAADLQEWYRTTHIPDVMRTPGMIAYHRFINAREDGDRQFVVMCEVDEADVDAVFDRMTSLFPRREDKEARRRASTEGRLITYSKATWQANFKRIL